jgi:hypothetical protein
VSPSDVHRGRVDVLWISSDAFDRLDGVGKVLIRMAGNGVEETQRVDGPHRWALAICRVRILGWWNECQDAFAGPVQRPLGPVEGGVCSADDLTEVCPEAVQLGAGRVGLSSKRLDLAETCYGEVEAGVRRGRRVGKANHFCSERVVCVVAEAVSSPVGARLRPVAVVCGRHHVDVVMSAEPAGAVQASPRSVAKPDHRAGGRAWRRSVGPVVEVVPAAAERCRRVVVAEFAIEVAAASGAVVGTVGQERDVAALEVQDVCRIT